MNNTKINYKKIEYKTLRVKKIIDFKNVYYASYHLIDEFYTKNYIWQYLWLKK